MEKSKFIASHKANSRVLFCVCVFNVTLVAFRFSSTRPTKKGRTEKT